LQLLQEPGNNAQPALIGSKNEGAGEVSQPFSLFVDLILTDWQLVHPRWVWIIFEEARNKCCDLKK
jgi:hypothetical protein